LNKKVWESGIKGVPFRLRVRISRKRNDEEGAKEKLYSYVQAVNVKEKETKGLHTVVVEDSWSDRCEGTGSTRGCWTDQGAHSTMKLNIALLKANGAAMMSIMPDESAGADAVVGANAHEIWLL
jgi:hypothetical protein